MDADLVARLRGVIPRLARELNDTSTGEGLTPTQYSVLALVRSRGPLGLAELTELEGLNPTMVTPGIAWIGDPNGPDEYAASRPGYADALAATLARRGHASILADPIHADGDDFAAREADGFAARRSCSRRMPPT